MRRAVPWILILCFTVALMAATTHQTLRRYHSFRSGWSWDLAYYNQWFRALIHGEEITVRPIGPWCQEGPSVWKMNYLAPIRFAIVPIYRVFPDPRTLLIVQVIAMWMVIPAAFVLVRSESGSTALALSAAALVPLTPLLWLMAWNDFRELQLAPPFVLLAIHGVRERSVRATALGVGGLLACRQEFSLLVASLALLPPRAREDIGHRFLWARVLWLTGFGWLLLGFLVYSRWAVNANTVQVFLGEMDGPRLPLALTLRTAVEFLLLGLASWAVLACLAPRAAVLVLPWLLSLSGGRWALRLIETGRWPNVRYAVPMMAMALGAGCLGYARLGGWMAGRPRGPFLLVVTWLVAAGGLLTAGWSLAPRFAHMPRPISSTEAEALWTWIGRVGPDEGVIAHYEVTAPLSSRRWLYSYVMRQNLPPGYPDLAQEIMWVFLRAGDSPSKFLTDQGFRLVHDGPHILVFHREVGGDSRQVMGRPDHPVESLLNFPPRPRMSIRGEGVPETLENQVYLAIGYAILMLIGTATAGFFLAPGLDLSLWARRRIQALRTLDSPLSGLTGEGIVAAICRSEGLSVVPVEVVGGPLADYYDSSRRSIRLSAAVATGRSLADHATAARETAYSLQHARGDHRVVLRNMLVFVLRLGTISGWLAMIAGVMLWSWPPIQAGALLITLSAVIPLPFLLWVERGASRLAIECFSRAGLVGTDERPVVTTALAALSWTQIAAVAPPVLTRLFGVGKCCG